jgi:hypothetical protein
MSAPDPSGSAAWRTWESNAASAAAGFIGSQTTTVGQLAQLD